jgi:hypothetical protein
MQPNNRNIKLSPSQVLARLRNVLNAIMIDEMAAKLVKNILKKNN